MFHVKHFEGVFVDGLFCMNKLCWFVKGYVLLCVVSRGTLRVVNGVCVMFECITSKMGGVLILGKRKSVSCETLFLF